MSIERMFSSGAVADQLKLPRWRFLYLIERGAIPGPSIKLPGRRVFTAEDVGRIRAVLSARPELAETQTRSTDCRPADGSLDLTRSALDEARDKAASLSKAN